MNLIQTILVFDLYIDTSMLRVIFYKNGIIFEKIYYSK